MSNDQILTAANVLTAFRLGLFAWFIVLLDRGGVWAAAVVFAVAWGLDAVDGYIARRFNHATEAGSLFDKAADRLMLGGAALAGMAYGFLPAAAVLLFAKDILTLIMLLRYKPAGVLSFGLGGKIATLLTGIALIWGLADWPYPSAMIAIAAVFGAGVVIRLWKTSVI